MADKFLKIVEAFYAAKRVNHYYWMHTDGDDESNSIVSVENIQKIVALLTGYKIDKEEVDVPSEFHRALIERSDDGKSNMIWVIASEPNSWKRFATVKELCHILIDRPEDFQGNPCITIDGLKDGSEVFEEHSTPEANSERLAEIIAMELLYPLDHRREDREKLRAGKSLEEIAIERDVPTKYVSVGVSDAYFEMCVRIWKDLKEVDPPNLDHILQNIRP